MESIVLDKKILFIDIDDCLLMHKGENAVPEFSNELEKREDFIQALHYYEDLLSKEHMQRIKKIADQNVYFIIHSTWRNFYELQDFKKMFSKYGIPESTIIDIETTHFQYESKPKIIQNWINRGVNNYAIIDNDLFIIPDESRFILINDRIGFDDNAYQNVCRILNINP